MHLWVNDRKSVFFFCNKRDVQQFTCLVKGRSVGAVIFSKGTLGYVKIGCISVRDPCKLCRIAQFCQKRTVRRPSAALGPILIPLGENPHKKR